MLNYLINNLLIFLNWCFSFIAILFFYYRFFWLIKSLTLSGLSYEYKDTQLDISIVDFLAMLRLVKDPIQKSWEIKSPKRHFIDLAIVALLPVMIGFSLNHLSNLIDFEFNIKESRLQIAQILTPYALQITIISLFVGIFFMLISYLFPHSSVRPKGNNLSFLGLFMAIWGVNNFIILPATIFVIDYLVSLLLI